MVSKFQLGLSENKNTHFFSANRPDGYCQGDLTIRKNWDREDGYSTGKDKNKSLNMKTKIGDILINKGEGSVMKDEDFVTSPNENSNDLSTPLDTDSNINKENDNTKNN